MKRGILRVSDELLRRALLLPDTVSIMHVSRDSQDFSASRVSIYLVGAPESDLPEVPEGCPAPWVEAECEYGDDGTPRFKRFLR